MNTNLSTGDIIAESLISWGVDIVFGIPGYGINGFIDTLRKYQDKIRFVLVRHEESAAFMACAYAKYTQKIGVCVATSGPGAINLLTGLYDAKSDNIPVLAITGNTYSDLMGSGYPQDVNLVNLFSDVSVTSNMVLSAEHAEMVTDMAIRTALTKKGVSHINIPIDTQQKTIRNEYTIHKIPGHTSRFLMAGWSLQINF